MRKGVDATSYKVRFTPRKPDSYWSAVNTRRMEALIRAGRIADAGRAAFERRDAQRTAKYSFEREAAKFSRADERTFRASAGAWEFFRAQAPWYQRVCTHWVTTAKREETRQRRLAELTAACAAGRRIDLLAPRGKR